jgi:broad specificity phosphatase PhoE/orotate phosphoribosyltransferase
MGEKMKEKTVLIIVRHAEAEGNANRLFHGWTDSKITKKGHFQALAVAKRLSREKIDVVYSSSLKRTLQTAEYISEVKNLPIIRTDKLKEINGGDWEDILWEILPEKWPKEYHSWEKKPHKHRMPNGESMTEFQSRIVDEFKYIINKNKGKNVCVVTHGTAIKSLMCFFKGLELEEMINIPWYDNTSVTIVEHSMIDNQFNKFIILTEGDTSHLEKDKKILENQEKLIHSLFNTNALKVSQADKPFWYTSGTIGPYYINTHFLYGNEEKANDLLEFINEFKENVDIFSAELENKLWDNYNKSKIYKEIIDNMLEFIKHNIDVNKVDFVSGGERRDWFFSFLIAKLLNKPHLTIYKNLDVYMYFNNAIKNPTNLSGKNILHVADLITEASSFARAWIPALKEFNGKIKWSVVVVDRKQGGEDLLKEYNINLYSMVKIDRDFFKKALELELINEEQNKLIKDFLNDPKSTMRNFLINNPDFLNNTLKSGGKDSKRAKSCIEDNIYDI